MIGQHARQVDARQRFEVEGQRARIHVAEHRSQPRVLERGGDRITGIARDHHARAAAAGHGFHRAQRHHHGGAARGERPACVAMRQARELGVQGVQVGVRARALPQARGDFTEAQWSAGGRYEAHRVHVIARIPRILPWQFEALGSPGAQAHPRREVTHISLLAPPACHPGTPLYDAAASREPF